VARSALRLSLVDGRLFPPGLPIGTVQRQDRAIVSDALGNRTLTVNRSKYDAFREVKLRLDNISISLPWLLAVLFFIKQ
jgi:hypothetical protein